MSSEQVWHRFEKKSKDGRVWKLRIQDLPPARLKDAIDLLANFFARDEAVHRAVGIANNPVAMEGYRKYYELHMSDPSYRMVICCSDDTPEVTKLMGLSIMSLSTDVTSLIKETLPQPEETEPREVPQETEKLLQIAYEYLGAYNPVTEFNLDIYYDDKGIVVDPEYRGLGIAENFLRVRRLMCKAHGVPMTGAWMTAFGTQKAGDRDGWETVKEIEYDYLAKKYDVAFIDVPRTMKFMIAKVGNTSSTKKLIDLYERIANNPVAMERYRKYYELHMSDPSYRMVICCSDDTPEVTKLMGLSIMSLSTDVTSLIKETLPQPEEAEPREVPQETKKLQQIVHEFLGAYNPVTEFNLDIYYDDKGIVVDPEYRGLGIAENFLKVRRLMCKAHGVPMTGAWMTAFGTQKAGARDGWETVKEIEYDYLAKKYDVAFIDVPRTMKFMIAKVSNTSSSTKKLIDLYESIKNNLYQIGTAAGIMKKLTSEKCSPNGYDYLPLLNPSHRLR
ncbi:uncharacterized protein isoform X2 [Choristoneura fumiferana]|uniref:uncharacterized protein isoform X2 n=1 Tax=Choristoneura fumiferana TaxID=7141 RepID=UPI003D155128